MKTMKKKRRNTPKTRKGEKRKGPPPRSRAGARPAAAAPAAAARVARKMPSWPRVPPPPPVHDAFPVGRSKPFKEMTTGEKVAYLQQFSMEQLAKMRAHFLELLSHGKKHSDALEESGLPWEFLSRLMSQDRQFEKEYDAARDVRDRLLRMKNDDNLIERGIEGRNVPIVVGGVTIGMEHQLDQRSFEIALKSMDRARYGDRQDVTVRDGGKAPAEMSDEELELAAAAIRARGKT